MDVNLNKMENKVNKNSLKIWSGRILNLVFGLCICIVIYVLAQLFFVTSFRIPSDSMEPSLLTGDYILVDKCSKGARLFDVLGALDKEDVKIHRMPGWRDFRRNDVLVFNFPYPGRWDSIVFDVMTYYVKRCIAVPGDTLEIRNSHFRIRGYDGKVGNVTAQDELQKLMESGEAETRGVVVRSYPNRDDVEWSIADFGPFYIPAKGDVMEMTPQNKLLYGNVIEWEQKKKLKLRGDTVWMGDSIISEYRFQENYYFVSGDKMANSRDSRYWGLLPEPFIVGRAWRIWKSVDRGEDAVRWNRILKKIE